LYFALSLMPSMPLLPSPPLPSPPMPSMSMSPRRSSSLAPLRKCWVSTPLTTPEFSETPTHSPLPSWLLALSLPPEPSCGIDIGDIITSPAPPSTTLPSAPKALPPQCCHQLHHRGLGTLSVDPDSVVCHSCCKVSYNYHWYNHCFMRHMAKSRK
jgi:hypothetical protein